jgi:hypothetical protein
VFDISLNAFTGTYPVFVFKYLSDVQKSCGCRISANVSGPDMRLDCPADQTSLIRAAALTDSKLECFGTDGSIKDLANYLVTGQLKSIPGSVPSSSASGPNPGIIAGAVIGALLGLALLVGGGYLGYKRYSAHAKATGFVTMKDEIAEAPVENPLEEQGPQV